jgi:hypothetical protein
MRCPKCNRFAKKALSGPKTGTAVVCQRHGRQVVPRPKRWKTVACSWR